ncbi:hypothetical protein OSB04_025016 [Centaurea solstitialis]|uniref:Reverse transcriptase Ty1/copia-type domain-containing protein n=1 Tax=Centaurea solstitialis TaxID=347529 RepID=A0AA38SMB0_9ASTR|nr:hypothetical protein OSB04_025016 [Centaurea solstitialis]
MVAIGHHRRRLRSPAAVIIAATTTDGGVAVVLIRRRQQLETTTATGDCYRFRLRSPLYRRPITTATTSGGAVIPVGHCRSHELWCGVVVGFGGQPPATTICGFAGGCFRSVLGLGSGSDTTVGNHGLQNMHIGIKNRIPNRGSNPKHNRYNQRRCDLLVSYNIGHGNPVTVSHIILTAPTTTNLLPDPSLNEASTSGQVYQPPALRWTKDHPIDQVLGNPSSCVKTRRQSGNICLYVNFISENEPKEIDDALRDPAWVSAMQEELAEFIRNNVWLLVPRPRKRSIIGSKWIFKNKLDEIGTIIRNKARLVAQGYRQEEGIDYDETFAAHMNVSLSNKKKALITMKLWLGSKQFDYSWPLQHI